MVSSFLNVKFLTKLISHSLNTMYRAKYFFFSLKTPTLGGYRQTLYVSVFQPPTAAQKQEGPLRVSLTVCPRAGWCHCLSALYLPFHTLLFTMVIGGMQSPLPAGKSHPTGGRRWEVRGKEKPLASVTVAAGAGAVVGVTAAVTLAFGTEQRSKGAG